MSLNKKRLTVWLIIISGILFIISALGQGFYVIPEIKNTIKNASLTGLIESACIVYEQVQFFNI